MIVLVVECDFEHPGRHTLVSKLEPQYLSRLASNRSKALLWRFARHVYVVSTVVGIGLDSTLVLNVTPGRFVSLFDQCAHYDCNTVESACVAEEPRFAFGSIDGSQVIESETA